MIKADKLKNLILHILLISGFVFGGKEKLKVSLIMSDSNLKNTHKAVEMIFEQYPELRNQIDFKSYRGKKLQSQDLEFFSKSKLVFIWIHGFDSNVEKVQSEIEKIVKNGGKVYALGTSPAEEKYRDLGILFNKTVLKYGRAGGKINIANLIKNRLSKDFGFKLETGKVVNYPEAGIYDHHTDSLYTDVKTYFENYREYAKENPTIGFVVERSKITTEQTKHFKAVFNSVERFGFNVLPIFGMPVDETIKKFFLDKENNPIVDIIVPFSMWHGVNPDKVRPLLEKIGVPVINSVQLFNSEEKWLQSEKGIDIWQRTLLVAIPELMGLIQPTVTSSKEKIEGSKEENNYFDQKPTMRRVKVLRDRILGWYYLQKKKNSEKKIALLYYSYPPGKENIGASYLNVLPNSILNILKEFERNSYNLGGKELISDSIYTQVMSYGRNVGSWAGGEIENVVATGKPILVPVKEYKKWFSELDSKLRKSVTDYWGVAESSEEMIWRDAKGNAYLVIPGVKYGNILLAPQPARGASQDAEKLYHDVKVPPNHQYIAFYLYLQKSFRSDAIIHLGTHGTHEWLSGKEVGQDDKDPSDALIKGIPNIYPYVVDDVGEGLQAKRRGMAVIIDHMTPPFDKAGLNPELEKLTELINDHNVAESKSPLLKTAKLREINSIAIGTGIIKDLGVDSVKTEEEIHELEHYLKEILEKKTPFGLHTFGKVPEEKYIKSTAEAMVSVTTGLSAKKKKELTKEF
ncbi:MAG: cobaltochelatase subunit CobN, partial [Rhodothermaceae bacterium]